jgi:hypothetical protein
VLPKFVESTRFESENSCGSKPIESTYLSQRLIHGEVRIEAYKLAVGA